MDCSKGARLSDLLWLFLDGYTHMHLSAKVVLKTSEANELEHSIESGPASFCSCPLSVRWQAPTMASFPARTCIAVCLRSQDNSRIAHYHDSVQKCVNACDDFCLPPLNLLWLYTYIQTDKRTTLIIRYNSPFKE